MRCAAWYVAEDKILRDPGIALCELPCHAIGTDNLDALAVSVERLRAIVNELNLVRLAALQQGVTS